MGILCDWIEASTLFTDTSISTIDVRDILVEDKLCDTQGEADGLVGEAWGRLRSRQGLLGEGAPLRFSDSHIERTRKWQDVPEYAYCLAVSYAFWHPASIKGFGKDYTRQGELLEELTKEALACIFPGWEVHHTGWTRTKAQKIAEVVKGLAEFLKNPARESAIGKWVKEEANEAGLDIVLLRRFNDNEGLSPLFFLQCASGGNWEPKRNEPSIRTWEKVIDLSYFPQKAFVSPLALLEGNHHSATFRIEGLLLDRYRLLSGYRSGKPWTSAKLQKEIRVWLKPRLKKICNRERG